MDHPEDQIKDRLSRLGLHADDVPLDKLDSAVAALSCFPMYMVANVHAWSSDSQWKLPLVDLPGFEQIREAYAIGEHEAELDISRDHRRLLGTLLTGVKPSDRVIYEYALETLKLFLASAPEPLVGSIRVAVARMIVDVAKASGEGYFGGGSKVSAQEATCIDHIAAELGLKENAKAQEILAEVSS